MFLKMISFFALSLYFSACSHNPARIVPRENGLIESISINQDRYFSERDAIDKANSYCLDQNKTAVFVENETKEVEWPKEENQNRGIFSEGSLFTRGKDYRTVYRFRCQ